MAQPVALFQSRKIGSRDWTNQELAEFYRVEAALTQAGLRIFSDRGQTDEGDPWFVFCRAPDGDVVIHFARIGHDYLIASDTFPETLRGQDFRQLINRFAGQNPTLMALPPSPSRSRLFVHPSALLAAIVATAFFWIQPQDAVANTMDSDALDAEGHPIETGGTEGLAFVSSGLEAEPPAKIEGGDDHPQSRHLVLILSIMTMAATFDWVSDHAILGLVDNWILNDTPIEERIVAERLAPVLLTLDEAHDAVVRRAEVGPQFAGRPGDQGEGAAFFTERLETTASAIGRDSQDPRSAEIFPAGPGAKSGDTPLPQDNNGVANLVDVSSRNLSLHPSDRSASTDNPKAAPPNERLNASDSADLEAETGAISSALSFVLQEAQALQLELPIKALEDQQDLVVQSGYGLRYLVSRVSEVFGHVDQGEGQGVSFFQEIHHPIESDVVDEHVPIELDAKAAIDQDKTGSLNTHEDTGASNRSMKDLASQLDRYDMRMEPLVQAFLKNSPTVDLLMVDGNVVLFERDEARYGDEGFGVLSWALDDGSTLSLIGVLTDLPTLS
ncbi:hypothetical protein [Rhabdaerophilum sp. SD176]|uniref:hypothetical protein n=1 Tax=Rhabdaerophilum sp. SD176 TaxID=2983548 RepID=UPI0024E024E8|nr:hypothetical protein [Rhabdaerophilum sp. SD176]